MKNNTRKIFVALLVVLTLLMSVATLTVSAADEPASEGNTIYLNPGADWPGANAWFAAYCWNDAGNAWYKMADSDSDDYYEVVIPADYTNVIFCRMDPSKSGLDWTSKWNQSQDLSIPTDGNNCFNVTDSWNAENTGSWGKYTPSGVVATHTYTIAGDSAHLGSAWDVANTANDMTDENGDGIYEITYDSVQPGAHAFKVVRDHAWTYAWGGGDNADKDGNFVMNIDAISKVTIYFDSSTKTISFIPTPTGEVTPEVPGGETPEVPDDGGEGSETPALSNDYYLVGWIQGEDVGIEADSANLGPHKFVDGKYTIELTGDTYVQVKNKDMVIFGTESYVDSGNSAVFKQGGAEKLKVPAGKVTFTLVENSDGSLTLSYIKSGSIGGGSNTPAEPAENPIQPNEHGYYQIYVYNEAWWDIVSYYVWDNDSKDADGNPINNAWPGATIDEISDKPLLYSIMIESKWDNIIFNDGKKDGAAQSLDFAFISIDQSKIVYNNATGEWMALEDYDPENIPEKPEEPTHDDCEKVRVYLGNAFGWAEPRYYCWTDGASSLAGWPGTKMAYDDEKGLFYADICACFEKVIFNDGSGSQTANLFVPLKGDDKIVCDASLCVGQAGGSELVEGQSPWVKLEDYEIPEPILPPAFDVQIVIKDTANWGQVYIHYWGGDSETTDPGLPMEQGLDGLYYGIIPAGTIGFVIHNGNNWELQSPDLVVPNDGNNCYDNGTGEWSYVELEGEDDPVVPDEPVNPDDKPVTPDDPAEDEDKNDDGYTREELAEMNFFQKLWAVIVKFFTELFKGFKKN